MPLYPSVYELRVHKAHPIHLGAQGRDALPLWLPLVGACEPLQHVQSGTSVGAVLQRCVLTD